MEDNSVANRNDAVSVELPAPPGWKKKLIPRNTKTPKKNDVMFISPTGEEIKSKSQLDKYLKKHPGDLSASDFYWGTGDTPRRSARLGEKVKLTDSPGSDTPKKRQRKLNSKDAAEEEDDENKPDANEDKDGTEEETKGSAEPTVSDAGEPKALDEKEIAAKDVHPAGDGVKDDEKIINETVTASEELPANVDNMETEQEKGLDVANMEKPENVDNNLLPSTGLEENKAANEPTEAETTPLDATAQNKNHKDATKVEEPIQLNDNMKSQANEDRMEIEQEKEDQEALFNLLDNNQEAENNLLSSTGFEKDPAVGPTETAPLSRSPELAKHATLHQEESLTIPITGADAETENFLDAIAEDFDQQNKENPVENMNFTEAGILSSDNFVGHQQKEQNPENNSAKKEEFTSGQVF